MLTTFYFKLRMTVSLQAVALEVHPLYFGIPVAVACSFSFMLPAATPPNAIVFEIARLKIWEMVRDTSGKGAEGQIAYTLFPQIADWLVVVSRKVL